MSNALKRDLKKGDKVVLKNGQVFTITGDSFGMYQVCSGQALFGLVEGETETCRHEGYYIDAAATMRRFAETNGWTATA